jgi:hypothetical protein
MWSALFGSTAAVGSFCCRLPLASPLGVVVVASLEQATMVASVPPSLRT